MIAKRAHTSFTRAVQFDFNLNPARRSANDWFLSVGGRPVPMVLVRNLRARRYVLRLRPDGSARVTIPRGGSAAEARRFAERNREWLERQLLRVAAQPPPQLREKWLIGTELLFRGEAVKIEPVADGDAGLIRIGGEIVPVVDPAGDLRPAIERHLWNLAAPELTARLLELAAVHQLTVRRVTVRNQKSRWGSCSRRGTISLNWRLIQAPPNVRDYICLHELAHLREMNHSPRYWREVERLCPDYQTAERWLKQHAPLLR